MLHIYYLNVIKQMHQLKTKLVFTEILEISSHLIINFHNYDIYLFLTKYQIGFMFSTNYQEVNDLNI